MMVYSSVLCPELLERAAAAPIELQTQVADMLDSITHTRLCPEVHQWYNDVIAEIQQGAKHPRGADMETPNATHNYIDFFHIGEKRSALTNMHGCGFSCKHGKKGKYMCCLIFKRGLHKQKTCPLMIILFKSENIEKKQHADVQGRPLDKDTLAMLNASNDALSGALKRQHPIGPIVWELTRDKQDVYYCENNIITTNLVGCAKNSSPITSTTSGEATKEYMSEYMVKEKANFRQAVPSLLAAMDEILVHLSKADNMGTSICTGKHLAQRTVNVLSGSHQWLISLMASDLLGNRSIVSSELFRYIFPHANVSFNDSMSPSKINLSDDAIQRISFDQNSNEYAQSCLDAVMAAV